MSFEKHEFVKSVYLRYIYLIFLTMLLLISSVSRAQDEFGCDLISNKKVLKKFEKAKGMSKTSRETYKLLVELTKEEPDFVEALYLIADINKQKADRSANMPKNRRNYESRAKNYYQKVIDVCPAYDNYYSYYFCGKYFYQRNEYQKSDKYLNLFLSNNSIDQTEIADCQRMKEKMKSYLDIMNNPVPFEPVVIKGVSTNSDEYLPLISPDGEFIFFTHRFLETDKHTSIQKQVEHFTISQRLDDDTGKEIYGEGEKMPIPFNQGQNQGAAAITIDNNHIYMTICLFTDISGQPYKNCDIYSSDFVNGAWTDFMNLGPNINGENSWESQPSISADGKTLFFSSIRESNLGFSMSNQTSDIYSSSMDAEGNWMPAKNLGTRINTEGNEKSPFLHSDSKTLYFSSDGRTGVGGYDIYFSKQVGETHWDPPTNIGYPINTEEDDIGFIVSTDGRKAYFSSNKLNGNGGWDIYYFDLYEKARPERVLFVKGQLLDEEGNEITDAKVEMRSAFSDRVTEGMVDKMTGKYAVAVSYEPEEEFIMTVKKKDYAFTSRYFSPSEIEDIEIDDELEIELKPIEVGVVVKLHNILFDTNSDKIYESSKVVLNNFIDFLKENEGIKFEIHGHTDDVGTAASNLDLSNRRAKAIQNYLTGNGIAANRMTSKGFGESKPVADNATPAGRALNRRTEFLITDK